MADEIKLSKLAECAGCSAKVGAGTLSRLLSDLPVTRDENLLVGFDKSDDACVYRVSDDLAIVQTLDFFPPMCDDPYTFGAIAATNALSDIYAMGGVPKTALNIMAVPEDMEPEIVHAILRGGYDKAAEAGAVIAGGHSIYDKVPKYGLSVTGFVDPRKMLRNDTAMEGDALFLTKPLGIGILTTAMKADLVDEETKEKVYAQMQKLNKYAAETLEGFEVHACTDVTGFGLMGHTLEMASGCGLTAVLETKKIPVWMEALGFAEMGIIPAGMYRNRKYAQAFADPGDVALAMQDVLYDPQTSGGLLFAIADADADRYEASVRDTHPEICRIGYMKAAEDGVRIRLI